MNIDQPLASPSGPSARRTAWIRGLLHGTEEVLEGVESLYFDLHEHPELSGQEVETAGKVAGSPACGRPRGPHGRRRSRGRGRAAQRTRARGRRPWRHGRPSGRGEDQPRVREHGPGAQRERRDRAGHARMRSRRAHGLSRRRGGAARAPPRRPGAGRCSSSGNPRRSRSPARARWWPTASTSERPCPTSCSAST